MLVKINWSYLLVSAIAYRKYEVHLDFIITVIIRRSTPIGKRLLLFFILLFADIYAFPLLRVRTLETGCDMYITIPIHNIWLSSFKNRKFYRMYIQMYHRHICIRYGYHPYTSHIEMYSHFTICETLCFILMKKTSGFTDFYLNSCLNHQYRILNWPGCEALTLDWKWFLHSFFELIILLMLWCFFFGNFYFSFLSIDGFFYPFSWELHKINMLSNLLKIIIIRIVIIITITTLIVLEAAFTPWFLLLLMLFAFHTIFRREDSCSLHWM